ncbi:hypothetical protein [Paeniglutamicibacter sp. Y32M11]|uniref:hypothetical protein n=1 Tax=Paeniglutamicibacter sp. Y32M11 TaxID=2853258 RepID=UPI001C52ACA0|nr:hypothetical protein [Paeniglutamicibacter sp. Y32M11]QXQ09636.1 hypothetical protein KUF55_14375 [Paeniglutamicibacter sp. Y32M11]
MLMDHFPSLAGVVVTAHALHTQSSHAHYLAGRAAHYIFTVKGNQPTLLKQLSDATWEQDPTGNRTSVTANGRQITCKSRPVGTKKWLLETVYAVTSLPTYQASPTQLASWVRGHWGHRKWSPLAAGRPLSGRQTPCAQR